MGIRKLKNIAAELVQPEPKPFTLVERVAALEAQVQKIMQTREVGYGLHLIDSCEAMGRARREHEQHYADAEPRRFERLRQFLDTLVRHPTLALSASELWGGYGEWLRRQVLPAGAVALESFPDALALQSAAVEVLGDTVPRGTNGIVGMGLLPPKCDAVAYLADLDRREAEAKRVTQTEADRVRGMMDLACIRADANKANVQAEVDRRVVAAARAKELRAAAEAAGQPA